MGNELRICYIPFLNSDALVGYEETLETVGPQIVIMDMMGEDLPYLQDFEYLGTVVQNVIDIKFRAFQHYSMPVVMALSAIQRATDMNCSVPTNKLRMESAHYHLRSLADHSPLIEYKKVKGFSRMSTGEEMPISFYTSDGVTPGPEFNFYCFL